MIDAGGVQLYAEQAGQGDDVIFISGLADEGACWVDQVAGLSDRWRITTFDNRGVGQSRDAAGRVPDQGLRRRHRGADGRARHRAGACRGVVDGRRDRPGADARAPGQGAQPRPQRDVLPRRPLLPRGHPQLAMGRAEVRQSARLPQRREPLVLRAEDLQRRHDGGVADGSRREPERPVGRCLLPLGRRAARARQLRPRRGDLGAGARDRRGARPVPPGALRPRARRADPRRAVPGHPAAGPSAVPGGAGGVQRAAGGVLVGSAGRRARASSRTSGGRTARR